VIELGATVQKETLEGRALEPDFFEDCLSLGGAGEPVELCQEVPEQADAFVLAVVGEEGAEQTFELGAAAPVRTGRRRGRPLRPFWCRGSTGQALSLPPVNPGGIDREVRIKIL
jgi:hypothetical protein